MFLKFDCLGDEIKQFVKNGRIEMKIWFSTAFLENCDWSRIANFVFLKKLFIIHEYLFCPFQSNHQ